MFAARAISSMLNPCQFYWSGAPKAKMQQFINVLSLSGALQAHGQMHEVQHFKVVHDIVRAIEYSCTLKNICMRNNARDDSRWHITHHLIHLQNIMCCQVSGVQLFESGTETTKHLLQSHFWSFLSPQSRAAAPHFVTMSIIMSLPTCSSVPWLERLGLSVRTI